VIERSGDQTNLQLFFYQRHSQGFYSTREVKRESDRSDQGNKCKETTRTYP
jgi:hypothetical protein